MYMHWQRQRCIVLHRAAVCCYVLDCGNTLQHTATHCNTLQHTAKLCNTLQLVAAHCNASQHTATHCNSATSYRLPLTTRACCAILQHTATHWNTLSRTASHCNTLQHIKTDCNRLQHTATHCNTLQHTAILHILPSSTSACSRSAILLNRPFCTDSASALLHAKCKEPIIQMIVCWYLFTYTSIHIHTYT